jgi:hypothetical protein
MAAIRLGGRPGGGGLDPVLVGQAVDALIACAEACTGWAGVWLECAADDADAEVVDGLVACVRECVAYAKVCAGTARTLGRGGDASRVRGLLEDCVRVCGKHAAAHQDWDCAEACWAGERACRELLEQL